MPDAVVIGAGPNGLVAANVLADAGWSVEVLEEQPEPGGAVRHDRGVHPAFVNDLFSSFYPLAAASPVLAALRLEDHGLRWSHAPSVLAHPSPTAAAPCWTATSHHRCVPRHLRAGRRGRLASGCTRCGSACTPTSWAPFSRPSRPSARAAGWRCGCGPRADCAWPAPWCCRCAAWGRRSSAVEGGSLLLAGNALHADLAPESAGSGGFGWLMAMLGRRTASRSRSAAPAP